MYNGHLWTKCSVWYHAIIKSQANLYNTRLRQKRTTVLNSLGCLFFILYWRESSRLMSSWLILYQSLNTVLHNVVLFSIHRRLAFDIFCFGTPCQSQWIGWRKFRERFSGALCIECSKEMFFIPTSTWKFVSDKPPNLRAQLHLRNPDAVLCRYSQISELCYVVSSTKIGHFRGLALNYNLCFFILQPRNYAFCKVGVRKIIFFATSRPALQKSRATAIWWEQNRGFHEKLDTIRWSDCIGFHARSFFDIRQERLHKNSWHRQLCGAHKDQHFMNSM